MSYPDQLESLCPQCGAPRPTEQKTCWLCHAPRPAAPRVGESIVTAEVVHTPAKFAPRPWSFSLAGLMAVMTLVAVGLGLGMVEPGLGILFAFIAVPALIITITRTRSERNVKGREVGWGERILTFLVSTAVVFAVLIGVQAALVIALFAVCIAIIVGASASGSL